MISCLVGPYSDRFSLQQPRLHVQPVWQLRPTPRQQPRHERQLPHRLGEPHVVGGGPGAGNAHPDRGHRQRGPKHRR